MARLTFDIEPAHLVAGQPYVGTVIVRAAQAGPAPRIGVTIAITEGWKHTWDTKKARERSQQHPVFAGAVAESVQLAAGESRFPIAFMVPAALPPTHETGPVKVECTATIEVGGAQRTLLLRVVRPPVQRDRGAPIVLTGTEPGHLTLALPASTYALGEWIEGRVLLTPGAARAHELVVTFSPFLHLKQWVQPLVSNDYPISQRVPVPVAPAGTVVPFAVQIPLHRAPSLDCEVHGIDWQLTVRSGNSDDRQRFRHFAPITLVPAGSQLGPFGPVPALPGRDDFAALRVVAVTAGWELTGLEATRPSTTHRKSITVDYLDGGRAFRLTLDFAPLGLGLRVTPTTRLRDLFSRDLDIGIAAWDRAHRASATAAEPAAIFLRHAVTTLAAIPHLVTGEWTDSRLTATLPFNVVDLPAFTAAVAALDAMHLAIEAARSAIAPAVPTGPYR